MKRALLLLLCSALSLFAGPVWTDDFSTRTRIAIDSLRIGAREDDIVARLKPVSLDSGRITWGGTGSGRYYFRISGTQQLYVDFDGPKGSIATRISPPEPLGVWKRDPRGNLSVEPRNVQPQ